MIGERVETLRLEGIEEDVLRSGVGIMKHSGAEMQYVHAHGTEVWELVSHAQLYLLWLRVLASPAIPAHNSLPDAYPISLKRKVGLFVRICYSCWATSKEMVQLWPPH